MVKEADFKHNGKISFAEFQKLMRDEIPGSPGGIGSPLRRKRTGRLDGQSENELQKSPSRLLKRRPSRALNVTPTGLIKGQTPHLLPIQIDDRSVQLGAPSPLMKQGRKQFKQLNETTEEKRLWAEQKIPEAVGEEKTTSSG